MLPPSAPLAPATYMPLGVGRPTLSISPDGEQIVYVAAVGNSTQLLLRTNGGKDPRPLPGTAGGHSPFFSPNGKWIGFFADAKLKKMSLEGGPPVVVCDAVLPFGGFWSEDDQIYFTPNEAGPVYRVSANGGTPERVAKEFGEYTSNWQSWPELLPGGKVLLLAKARLGIGVYDFAAQRIQWLTKSGSYPRWSPTGHILYLDGGTLWALPFDSKALKPTGPSVLVADQVRMEQQGAAQYAVSPDGTLIYVRGGDVTEASLVWVDRSGAVRDIGLPPRRYGEFRISPDGRTLAVVIQDQAQSDLWLFDIERKSLSRLTRDSYVRAPVWAPDGKRLVYSSNATGENTIFEISVDGSQRRAIVTLDGPGFPMWFCPDGKRVTISAVGTTRSIRIVNTETGEKVEIGTQGGFPAVSPDGRWLAYASSQSDRSEVEVRSFGTQAGKWRVSTDGGEEPIWSRNGRTLFYRNGDKWMEVEVTSTPEFRSGRPRQVITGPYVNIPGLSYDVAADGRFLVLKSEYQDKMSGQIEIIQNWPELLKQASR